MNRLAQFELRGTGWRCLICAEVLLAHVGTVGSKLAYVGACWRMLTHVGACWLLAHVGAVGSK